MIEMKYVVVKSKEQGEQLFICHKDVNHDFFAEMVTRIKYGTDQHWERIFREVVSAGFTDGVNCYGHSETLKLSSRPEDTALLQAGGQSK